VKQFLGIEIGGTKLQIVRGNGQSIHECWKYSVDRTAGANGIRHAIENGLRDLTRNQKIDAVGIGFGGPVNWRTGSICKSHQIEGWSGFNISEWISARTSAPVTVDNDANVAALGEALLGAGMGFDPVFYVTLGSGVGGGLIADGTIYHGASPGEAEIGHIRLDTTGTTLESQCSGWAVDRAIRAAADQNPGSALARLARAVADCEAKCLGEALRVHAPEAEQILRGLCENLAFGLSHVVHLFHPQVIILGGGLSSVGEPLRSGVTKALSGFVMEAFSPGPRIEIAALKEDAVPLGALLLAERNSSR
jgi:glucokinase